MCAEYHSEYSRVNCTLSENASAFQHMFKSVAAAFPPSMPCLPQQWSSQTWDTISEEESELCEYRNDHSENYIHM